jgi:hypothetical protein
VKETGFQQVCFHELNSNLCRYQTARAAFVVGKGLDAKFKQFPAWIEKCDVRMEREMRREEGGVGATAPPAPAAAAAAASVAPASAPAAPAPAAANSFFRPRGGATTATAPGVTGATGATNAIAPAATAPAATPAPPPAAAAAAADDAPPVILPRYKHQWYQSQSHVTLEVMAKKVDPTHATIAITADRVVITVNHPDDATDPAPYVLDILLFGGVVVEESKGGGIVQVECS